MKHKKCLVNTKKGHQCKRNAVFFGYCRQHWPIVLKKRIMIVVTVIGALAGIFGIIRGVDWLLKKFRQTPQYEISPRDGNIRGILLKDELGLEKNEFFIVKIGANSGTMSRKVLQSNPPCIIAIKHLGKKDCGVRIKEGKNNELLFSLLVFDKTGEYIGEIVDNKVTLNRNRLFQYNYDEKALEIIDNDGYVLLSIEYSPPNTILIEGVLPVTQDGQLMVMNRNKGFPITKDYQKVLEYVSTIEKKFAYTGNDFIGKRLPIENK